MSECQKTERGSLLSLTDPSYRELGVYYLHHGLKNLLICDSSPSKTALYYADINMRTKNAPDVKLYSLPATPPRSGFSSPEFGGVIDGTMIKGEAARASGEVVGTAWFRSVRKSKTRNMRLCLGDPEKVRGAVWADMRDVKKYAHGEYAITIPASEKAESAGFENPFMNGFDFLEEKAQSRPVFENRGAEGQRIFRWARTHSKDDGLENGYISRKWSVANFKLLDEKGTTVAVFESNGMKSFRKKGKLKIYQHHPPEGLESWKSDGGGTSEDHFAGRHTSVGGENLEAMIVLSHCVIEEKLRRGI